MFKAQAKGTRIDVDARHVVALRRSTNTQSIALGAGLKAPTRAYVVSAYEGGKGYRVYVFFGLVERDGQGRPQGLLFLCDPPYVGLSAYETLQQQALGMVQGQGFEMEGSQFQAAPPAVRSSLLADLPFRDGTDIPPPPTGPIPPFPTDPALVNSTQQAAPLSDVSREISLTQGTAVQTLGRLLALF